MKAITVEPHVAGSARLEDFPEPDLREGSVLVEAIAVGVCGTDVGSRDRAASHDRHLLRGARARDFFAGFDARCLSVRTASRSRTSRR